MEDVNWLPSLVVRVADDECSFCKMPQEKQDFVKYLTSKVCKHRFCERCVDREVKRGALCPMCQHPVKKVDLVEKTVDEIEYEDDMRARKEVYDIYNKTREDFATDDEYNNYLEEVEDLIYNLVNKINVEGVRESIEKYKALHSTFIPKKKSQKLNAEKELMARVDAQQSRLNERASLFRQGDREHEIELRRERAQLVEVELGKRTQVTARVSAAPTVPVGVATVGGGAVQVAAGGVGPMGGMSGMRTVAAFLNFPQPQPVGLPGQSMEKFPAKERRRLQRYAGGLRSSAAHERAWQEARSSLFLVGGV